MGEPLVRAGFMLRGESLVWVSPYLVRVFAFFFGVLKLYTIPYLDEL